MVDTKLAEIGSATAAIPNLVYRVAANEEALKATNARVDTGLSNISARSTAYAASSVDLSFGTPSQARSEAFRQTDLALETQVGSERTRVARLEERASNLRTQAATTRRAAKVSGRAQLLQGASRLMLRG